MQLVAPNVAGETLRGVHPGLGYEDPRVGIGVGDQSPGTVDVVDFAAVPVRMFSPARVLQLCACRDSATVEVGQPRLLDKRVGHVDPEPVHAPVEPELEDRLERGVNLRVIPVDVGLLGGEQMQVPLPWPPIHLDRAGPRGTAENAEPVVGGLIAILAATRPEHVALPLARTGPGRQGRLEPRVLIRRVVRHKVQNEFQSARMHLGQQVVKVGKRAEDRVDAAIV